jgi:hypothetical protein
MGRGWDRCVGRDYAGARERPVWHRRSGLWWMSAAGEATLIGREWRLVWKLAPIGPAGFVQRHAIRRARGVWQATCGRCDMGVGEVGDTH